MLRHTEHILVEIFDSFIGLLSQLAGERRIALHIVAINSALAPLPLQLEKASRALIDVRIFATVPPWKVYDAFISKVVSTRQIPVSLPPALWTFINEIFWRSNCSVRSALDIILLSLSHHFEKRRSLLSMFEEHQWLVDMKLCKKKRLESLDDQGDYFLGQILAYMGGEDIEGTGLRLGHAKQATQAANLAETKYAKQLLSSALARQKIDRAWFKCLRMARDTTLYPKQLRREFPSDLLWAACKSPAASFRQGIDELYDSTIGALLQGIRDSLTRTPINDIHAFILALQGLLTELPSFVECVQSLHAARSLHRVMIMAGFSETG